MPDAREKLYALLRVAAEREAPIARALSRRNVGAPRRVAVLEPCSTSRDSNGDQALIAGTCRFILEKPGSSVELLTFKDESVAWLPPGVTHGGALFPRSRWPVAGAIRHLHVPWTASRYDDLFVIGADLMDGYYGTSTSTFLLWLLRVAALSGARTHLISFSFTEARDEALLAAMDRYLPGTRVHARDAISAARLTAVLGRTVPHSADVAFGLQPDFSPRLKAVSDWVSGQRERGLRVVALNVNMLPISRQRPGSEQDYLTRWTDWVSGFISRERAILLVPHDFRGEWSDDAAAERLLARIPSQLRDRVHTPGVRLTAAETKAMLSLVDLVVTGRMHVAIAALGVGVPAIGYAYQGKFEGIFALFGVESCVRPIQGIFDDVEAEIAFASHLAERPGDARAAILARSAHVLALAAENVR